jgi:deoxyribonuclease-1/deoxyribonuclease-1-like protein
MFSIADANRNKYIVLAAVTTIVVVDPFIAALPVLGPSLLEQTDILTDEADTIKIAAFNIQVFGRSKMDKPDVPNVLVRTISRYDLILVQEVRDSSGEAIQELFQLLNTSKYSLLLSERLGRTSSKEQYAWFYRSEVLRVVRNITAQDTADQFERPPQTVWWSLRSDPSYTIATVGLHAAPDHVVDELNALSPVVTSQMASHPANATLILGDLNADCSYLTKTEWKCIRSAGCRDTTLKLWGPQFRWLIDDSVDTTTSASDCAYDRFISYSIADEHFPPFRNAAVFKYDEAFGLDHAEAKLVSDHYPIELTLDLPTRSPTPGPTVAPTSKVPTEKPTTAPPLPGATNVPTEKPTTAPPLPGATNASTEKPTSASQSPMEATNSTLTQSPSKVAGEDLPGATSALSANSAKKSLSGGAIAGLTCVCLVGAATLLIVARSEMKRRQNAREQAYDAILKPRAQALDGKQRGQA